MKLLITICGRGGSKGIPGKNIRTINGVPLISISINTAKEFAKLHNADIALSTDSDAIKKEAAAFGLVTDYTRPAELATDSAGKIPVIAHLKEYEEKRRGVTYDYVLDLDITSPLRTIQDLEEALQMIENDKNCLNIFSANKAHRNPYFNMVEQKEDGYYGLVKPGYVFLTRQSSPKVYDLNASFYFYRKSFFEGGYGSAITERSLVYVMDHICFDLDEPIDFEFLEYLLSHDKLPFKL